LFTGFCSFNDPGYVINKTLNGLDLNRRYMFDACDDEAIVHFRYGRLTFPTKEAFCKFITSKRITFPEIDFYLVTILQLPNYKEFIYSKARDYVTNCLRVACGAQLFKNAREVMRAYTQNIGLPGVGPCPSLMTTKDMINILVHHTHRTDLFNKISLRDIRNVFPNFELAVENCTLTSEMLDAIKPYAYMDSLMPEMACAVFLSQTLTPTWGLTIFTIIDDESAWREPEYENANEQYMQCILSLAEYLMDVLCGATSTSLCVCDVRFRHYDEDDPLYSHLNAALVLHRKGELTAGYLPPQLGSSCLMMQNIRRAPTVAEERQYYHKLKALLHNRSGVGGDGHYRSPLSTIEFSRVRFLGKNFF
jgi:hypothetical protein